MNVLALSETKVKQKFVSDFESVIRKKSDIVRGKAKTE